MNVHVGCRTHSTSWFCVSECIGNNFTLYNIYKCIYIYIYIYVYIYYIYMYIYIYIYMYGKKMYVCIQCVSHKMMIVTIFRQLGICD